MLTALWGKIKEIEKSDVERRRLKASYQYKMVNEGEDGMKRINRGIEIIANGICPDKERGAVPKSQ